MDTKDFLPMREAADFVGKSYENFRYWMRKKDFPKAKKIFGKTCFRKKDLERYHFDGSRK